MKHYLSKLFSGKDNQTPDLGRYLWAFSLTSYVGITVYSLAHGKYDFDPVTWGAGCAALLASGGSALYAKASTEPFEIKTKQLTMKRGKTGDGDSEDDSAADESDEPVDAESEETK